MPNHVYQKIRVRDQNNKNNLRELKKKILNKNNELDFNLIIPQPENIFKGNLGEEELKMCQENNRPNWYHWNQEFWGTKWNAYSTQISKNKDDILEFTFLTAWSIPKPIVEKLFEFFQGCGIHYLAAGGESNFAIEISQDEDGKQTYNDLKECYQAILFALS